MRRTSNAGVVVTVMAGAALTLTGCAAAAASADDTVSAAPSYVHSQAQIKALADGVVDRAEYLAGFDNYQTCMSAAGYKVLVLDATSTVIDMRIPGDAVDAGVDTRCYQTEFVAIDDAWQTANQDSREDTALLDNCLVDNGVVPSVEAAPSTRQAKVDALIAAKIELSSCLPQ